MVDYSGMFRPDPSIKRGRRFADTFTQASLKPIAPPPGTNLYGFSPWGEAAQRLAAALGGRMASSSADQREAEQRAAQAQVMAQLLKVGSARPDQLIQTQMQEPGPGAMMRTQYSIGNDGSQRAIEPLPAGVFEKAGGIAGGYQTAVAAAKAQEDKLTQAGLERDIDRELSSVLGQENPNMALAAQLNALVRPKDELADIRKKAAAATKSAATRAGASPKQWEADLESLMRTHNLTEKQAGNIAYGRLIISRDPDTGVITLVNLATEEIIPLKEKEPASKAADGKPAPQGLYPRMVKGPDITGVVAAGQILGEGVLSQIPGLEGMIADRDQLALRTEYSLAVKDLKISLARNPRYSEGEQLELGKRLDIDPSILVGTDALLRRLEGANAYLSGKLVEEKRNSKDKSLPAAVRQAAAQSARAIEDFLRKLAVPKSVEEMSVEELRKIK